MNDVRVVKYIDILIKFFLSVNIVFTRIILHKIVYLQWLRNEIDTWLDKGELSGAILIDLSKVVDCIKHDPFVAKLVTYGFEFQLLKFVFSYLLKESKEQKHKTLTIPTLM